MSVALTATEIVALAGLGTTFATSVVSNGLTYRRDTRKMRQDAQIELEKLRREDQRIQLERWADRRLELYQQLTSTLLDWNSAIYQFVQNSLSKNVNQDEIPSFSVRQQGHADRSEDHLHRLSLFASDDTREAADEAQRTLADLSNWCIRLSPAGVNLWSSEDIAVHNENYKAFVARFYLFLDDYHRNARLELGTTMDKSPLVLGSGSYQVTRTVAYGGRKPPGRSTSGDAPTASLIYSDKRMSPLRWFSSAIDLSGVFDLPSKRRDSSKD